MIYLTEEKLKQLADATTVVVYHGGCPDGTAAAWLLSLVLDNNTTYYYPAKHENEPHDFKDKDIIFVDFTYQKDTMIKIIESSKRTRVWDHHKSANPIKSLSDIYREDKFKMFLDMNQCGAELIWPYVVGLFDADEKVQTDEKGNHIAAHLGTPPIAEPISASSIIDFFKKYDSPFSPPWFILDIGARDRWIMDERPGSKEVTRAFFGEEIYVSINNFYRLLNANRDEYLIKGKVLVTDDKRIFNMLARTATKCTLALDDKKYTVMLVETPHCYASDVGNLVAKTKECDFVGCYRYNMATDEWWVSCRADPEKDIDLTTILPKINPTSGGHPKAVGLTLKGSASLLSTFVPCDSNQN